MPTLLGIYFQHFGKHAEDNKPPVILIHGAGGSHLYWPANIRRLIGYEVYALDLPGHGRSSRALQDTILAYAESVDEWMAAAGLQKAIVIGHSMGSAIALTLALENPQLIAGLGLLGAGARLKVNPQILDQIGDAETFLATVNKVTKWSFSSLAPEILTALAEKRLAEAGPQVLHADFWACNAFDITADLGQIKQPALIICGQEDKMTPVQESRFLAENIPHARLELVPEAGHMVMLEKPEHVAHLLDGFLSTF